MDKEILDLIKSKLINIKTIINSTIDELDVETVDSPSTGKTIAPDFDDTDLTNVQVAVDDASSQLQDLSTEIDSYL